MAGSGNPFSTPIENECPSCKAIIKRYTYAQATYCGCEKCGNWFSISEEGELQRTKTLPKHKPSLTNALKLGAKFKWSDVDYVLISKADKADRAATQYVWREYGLFHPIHGYLWLSEYDGHWMFLKKINDNAGNQRSYHTITYDEKDFALYQKYKSTTLSACGEFLANTYGPAVAYEEFISPPYMLSCETGATYREWFLGEYISQQNVADGFGLNKSDLPERIGVGAIQPVNTRFSNEGFMRVCGFFIGLLFLIMIVHSSQCESNSIAYVNQSLPDSLMGTTIVSKPFTLTGRSTALSFEYSSNVNNNWSEADIMLINDKTQDTRGLTIGAECYSGVDDGEAWSEGSQYSSTILSSVEPGTYHLNIKPSKGSTGSGGGGFTINVVHDVAVMSNFMLLLGVLLLFPAINWLRRKRFETARWMNSDYTPSGETNTDE